MKEQQFEQFIKQKQPKQLKQLIISGDPKEIEAILDRLIEKYGNITIVEYLEKMNKEALVLL